MFFRYFCTADCVAGKSGIHHKLACKIAFRPLECAAGARILERLFLYPLVFQFLHAGKNFFFISRNKHKFCSKYDVASVFDDAGTVAEAELFFFQFPDLTFSCEYSDILYNILHLSAVGSRVHTDAAA